MCFSSCKMLSPKTTSVSKLIRLRILFRFRCWTPSLSTELATWFFFLHYKISDVGFEELFFLESRNVMKYFSIAYLFEMRIVWPQVRFGRRYYDRRVVWGHQQQLWVWAAGLYQPLLVTGFGILPSIWIVSRVNVRSCSLLLLLIHIACGFLLTTRAANDLSNIVHALHESTSREFEMFPILMGILRGSILLSFRS